MNDDERKGITCVDCLWFKAKCSWLLSYTGAETRCDWEPSRFVSIQTKTKKPEPEATRE